MLAEPHFIPCAERPTPKALPHRAFALAAAQGYCSRSRSDVSLSNVAPIRLGQRGGSYIVVDTKGILALYILLPFYPCYLTLSRIPDRLPTQSETGKNRGLISIPFLFNGLLL
jgi:hypothetical protein